MDKVARVIDRLRDVGEESQWDLQSPADVLKCGNLLPEQLPRNLFLARIADVQRARQILRRGGGCAPPFIAEWLAGGQSA